MKINSIDTTFLAVTAWKENRGGLTPGMQSVINVICNRATARGTSPYQECVRPKQFSSLTEENDPELILWPSVTDPQWEEAQSLAQLAALGTLEDITSGATLYYAPAGQKWTARFTLPGGTVVPFPDDWNESAVHFTVEIASQLFFREV
jgi:hypothetical protein